MRAAAMAPAERCSSRRRGTSRTATNESPRITSKARIRPSDARSGAGYPAPDPLLGPRNHGDGGPNSATPADDGQGGIGFLDHDLEARAAKRRTDAIRNLSALRRAWCLIEEK